MTTSRVFDDTTSRRPPSDDDVLVRISNLVKHFPVHS
ncbi:MAG: hypothetical protein QOF57_1866, partial [Frankiaceae bacterium]|nr:hypothetical protein [Frankiaceae bacterium]